MDSWYQDRIGQFESMVNLQSLPEVPFDRGIVVDWRNTLNTLINQGWEIFFTNTRYQDDGAIGEWGLKRGNDSREERLVVKVYVSSLGIDMTRNYFRRLAMSSTAPVIPYQRLPDDNPEVITLFVDGSLPEEQSSNDSLLRLYRNIVFEVRTYDATSSVLEVADQLLETAAQNFNEPLQEKAPTLLVHLAPPQNPQPGNEIAIGLPTEPDAFGSFQETNYEVHVQTSGDAIGLAGFHGAEVRFRLLKPGSGRIRVGAIDRRTLLSKELELDIKVGTQ